MPLELIPYQPFFTDEQAPPSGPCLDDPDYCHIVASDDPVNMQWRQSACEQLGDDNNFDDYSLGAQQILEPDFNTIVNWIFIGGSWTHAAGKLTHNTGNTNSVAQATAFTNPSWQLLVITVEGITTGSLSVNWGTPSLTISVDGTYKIFTYYTGAIQITLTPTSNFDGSIDYIESREVTWNNWAWTLGIQPSFGGGFSKTDTTITGQVIETVPNYLLTNEYYEVYVTVQNYGGSGELTVSCSDISQAFSGNGVHKLYAKPTVDGVIALNADTAWTGLVTNISIGKLRQDYEFVIVSTAEQTVDAADITYYNEWVNVNFESGDYLSPGDCFTIRVFDECDYQYGEYVTNGGFIGGSGPNGPSWGNNNAVNQYDYTGEQLKLLFDGNLFANSAQWWANNVANPAFDDNVGQITNYQIEYEIISRNVYPDGGGGGNKPVGDLADIGVTVRIYGQSTASVWNNTVGVHTQVVSLPANYPIADHPSNGKVQVHARANALGDPLPSKCDLTVDNITISKLAPYEATFETECIKVLENTDGTLLIQAACNQGGNQLGFNFDSGFLLSQRVRGRMLSSNYDNKSSQYIYSDGELAKYYSSRSKSYEIFVDLCSPSVHDTMSVMTQCDTFALGETFLSLKPYIAEDDYSPNYPRGGASGLAQGRLIIRPKFGNTIFKKSC